VGPLNKSRPTQNVCVAVSATRADEILLRSFLGAEGIRSFVDMLDSTFPLCNRQGRSAEAVCGKLRLAKPQRECRERRNSVLSARAPKNPKRGPRTSFLVQQLVSQVLQTFWRFVCVGGWSIQSPATRPLWDLQVIVLHSPLIACPPFKAVPV
jgi:hypothetical protein